MNFTKFDEEPDEIGMGGSVSSEYTVAGASAGH